MKVKTHNRSDVNLSFRRRVEIGEKVLETPTKAIPAGKLYEEDQILEEARGVNEFYKQVSSADLYQSPNDGTLHFNGLDRQLDWSLPGEVNFTFLEYTDSEQISKIDAYQMVGVLGYASDYFTVPLQPKILSQIDKDGELDDTWYHRLYNGTELFLRACHESSIHKPIMGGIPPLDLPHLGDLINLYEQYDVFAFYFDFDWNLPSAPSKVDRVAYFQKRIANQRHHDDVLLYALNARSGTFNGEIGYRPAADFAPALMGFDVIGENHSGPSLDPEGAENVERREDFRILKEEIIGYIDSPVDNLQKHFPNVTNVNVEDVLKKGDSYSAKRRFEKFLNAEQMELILSELRQKLEAGNSRDFLEEKSLNPRTLNAGKEVRKEFNEGLQTELGDYT